MGKIKASYVTDKGKQMLFSGSTVNYTKAVLYSQDVSNLAVSELRQLTSLTGELMTTPVGVSDKQDGSTSSVNVEATFTNAGLDHDIEFHSVGWFAKQGEDGTETLMAVQAANNGANLAAGSPNGATDAVDLTLSFAIGDTTTVTAVIDPAGSPTFTDLHNSANDIRSELHTALATKADKSDLEPLAKSVDVNKALDTKADKSQLPDLTPYAKTADVNASLDTKADKQTVADDLAKKADQSDVNEKLATKADKDGVDEALSKKADKTDLDPLAKTEDVNTELDKKADKIALDDYAKSSDVAADVKQLSDSIATKADAKTVDDTIGKIDFTPYAKTADVQAELDTKANTTDLAPFARSVDVNKQIEGVSTAITNANSKEQADLETINKALATKRDIADSYSKDELDKKFLQLSTDTGGKVDANQVVTMIENKADKSDVTKQIGTITDLVNTKANSTDVDAALDKKDDITDVDAKIKTVTDLANQVSQKADDNFNKRPVINGVAGDDLFAYKSNQLRLYPGNGQNCKNLPPAGNNQWYTVEYIFETPNNDGVAIYRSPLPEIWVVGNDGGTFGTWHKLANDDDFNNLKNQINTKANSSDVYVRKDVDSAFGEVRDRIGKLEGSQTVDSPDFNDLTASGVYYITNNNGANIKNNPVIQWGVLIVSNGDGHRISQVYYPDDGNSPWYRSRDESTWRSWYQLSTRYDVNNAVSLANKAQDTANQANTNISKIDLSPYAKSADVNSELANKASTTDVSNGLAGKADKSQVNVDGDLFSAPGSITSWASLQADGRKNVLRSVRTEGLGTAFNTGNYDAGILFGGDNTKALISVGCTGNRAIVTGGNNSVVWHEDIAWKSDVTNLQNQVNTKASASDVNSLNQTISALQQTVADLKNTISQQATQITGLQTLVNNQANEIKQLQETTIKGKTFSKSQEAAAEAWEQQNSQQIAFILDN